MTLEADYDKPYGITLNLNRDFVNALRWNRRKYGETFEKINGLHNSNLNFTDFIDNFEKEKTVGDATIDSNANVNTHDVVSLMHEMVKPHQKLLSLNKIYIEMEKKYGKEEANRWFENEYSGSFYLHDASSTALLPYCYSYDLQRLADDGLYFIAQFKTGPAKHLNTFVHHVQEFVSWASNRTSGACGLATFLFHSYGFWLRDVENGYYTKDPETYRRQAFQEFIYNLNQPYLRVVQSAFTNISIFDRKYLEELFGTRKLPNGDYGIDHIEDLIEHQKVFMEVVSDIRSKNMMTFPVLSYNLLYKDGKFVDDEFARWCSDHNSKWYDSNFMNASDVGTFSNCPLHGDTKILFWSNRYNRFALESISDVYANKKRDGVDTIEVISEGRRIPCKINKFNLSADYEIELVNGAKIKTTANHLNSVYGKEYVRTQDLTTDDYLPYSLRCYGDNDIMGYEDGKLVGMFLGDGSFRNSNEIVFSLNSETDKDDIDFLKTYCVKKFCATITEYPCTSSISGNSLCVNICVNSCYLSGLIKQFVDGDNALTKRINLRALNCSAAFRRGIIDGLYTTDGGNSNRIYTSSPDLKDTLIVIMASIGMVATVYTDNRDGRLGTTPNYVIRFYTPNGRNQRKGFYIIDGDIMWIKVKSIKRTHKTDVSYCLEVLDDSKPIFMLGNGIHTHNCRLLSDSTKLTGFINSIGGTALSIGSVKVNTINVRRISLESMDESGKPNEDEFFRILRRRTKRCCEVLDAIRGIIKRNVEKGFLPNYTYGLIEFDKQYCTIGVTAIYEVVKDFGLIRTDEFGYNYYTDDGIALVKRIFDTINEVKDSMDVDFTYNIENVPGESANKKLYQKDFLLFGEKKAGNRTLYANQWIALTDKCTIDEKIRTAAILDPLCSGGQIAHINLESPISPEQHWVLLNKIAKAGCQYFAFNPKISVCAAGHGFFGETCPECGGPKTDTFSRIVGYLVPTSNFERSRKVEFNERQWFDLSERCSAT